MGEIKQLGESSDRTVKKVEDGASPINSFAMIRAASEARYNETQVKIAELLQEKAKNEASLPKILDKTRTPIKQKRDNALTAADKDAEVARAQAKESAERQQKEAEDKHKEQMELIANSEKALLDRLSQVKDSRVNEANTAMEEAKKCNIPGVEEQVVPARMLDIEKANVEYEAEVKKATEKFEAEKKKAVDDHKAAVEGMIVNSETRMKEIEDKRLSDLKAAEETYVSDMRKWTDEYGEGLTVDQSKMFKQIDEQIAAYENKLKSIAVETAEAMKAAKKVEVDVNVEKPVKQATATEPAVSEKSGGEVKISTRLKKAVVVTAAAAVVALVGHSYFTKKIEAVNKAPKTPWVVVRATQRVHAVTEAPKPVAKVEVKATTPVPVSSNTVTTPTLAKSSGTVNGPTPDIELAKSSGTVVAQTSPKHNSTVKRKLAKRRHVRIKNKSNSSIDTVLKSHVKLWEVVNNGEIKDKKQEAVLVDCLKQIRSSILPLHDQNKMDELKLIDQLQMALLNAIGNGSLKDKELTKFLNKLDSACKNGFKKEDLQSLVVQLVGDGKVAVLDSEKEHDGLLVDHLS